MAETSLHAAIKIWYSRPGDRLEVPVDGYMIDLARDDRLVEIQTGNFANLRPKLEKLLDRYAIRLVHPIPVEKWILRYQDPASASYKRRKSPKHGRIDHLFSNLVSIPALIAHPNFSIEVLFTREEECWLNDQRGSWRRKGWSISDRRLIDIDSSALFESPADFRALLPLALPVPFTASDLAAHRAIPRNLARRMAYCLRKMGVIDVCGKRRRETLYMIVP